jgi:DNA transformation protein
MDRERIEELFAPFGPVAVKRMFGGHGVYADGVFFALEADGEIFLKVDAATTAVFEAAGSRPFVYQGGKKPVTMSYWLLPDAAHEDEDELRRWARVAMDAARRAQAVKTAKAGRRKPAAR